MPRAQLQAKAEELHAEKQHALLPQAPLKLPEQRTNLHAAQNIFFISCQKGGDF